MTEPDKQPDISPRRLCNEIQLFDLCDLDSCNHKEDRFCTDPDLLGRFEKIAENELRVQEHFNSEDGDDSEDNADGYDEDDNEFVMDNFEGDESDESDCREVFD